MNEQQRAAARGLILETDNKLLLLETRVTQLETTVANLVTLTGNLALDKMLGPTK